MPYHGMLTAQDTNSAPGKRVYASSFLQYLRKISPRTMDWCPIPDEGKLCSERTVANCLRFGDMLPGPFPAHCFSFEPQTDEDYDLLRREDIKTGTELFRSGYEETTLSFRYITNSPSVFVTDVIVMVLPKGVVMPYPLPYFMSPLTCVSATHVESLKHHRI